MRAINASAGLASLLLLVFPALLDAQRPDPGLIEWNVRVRQSMPLGLGQSRVYGEQVELGLELLLDNKSPYPINIAQTQLASAFEIELFLGDMAIPVATRWLSEARLTQNGDWKPTGTKLSEIIAVPSGATVTWNLRVSRTDGLAFGPGQYGFAFGMQNLERAVQRSDGGVWTGRIPGKGGAIGMVLTAPVQRSDVVAMHTAVANDAMRYGAYEDALSAFERAVAADPTATTARTGVAAMNVALNRYSVAVSVLERLLAEKPAGDTRPISEMLASAYVGVGDEQAATRILRNLGWPEERVSLKLEQIRTNRDSMKQR